MTYDRPDLSGRVAFVTGTTRGIGKRIALALAECGCDVVSTGKTSEADESGSGGSGSDDEDLEGSIEQTAREIEERGAESIAIQLNVRDEAAIEAAIDRTIEEFDRIDICINNAGAIQLASVEEMPVDRFDLMMDVNVRGAYAVSRAVLPHMTERGGGHILMASPPNRTRQAPGKAAYALSKFGMTFVAQSLAEEVREDDVAVNAFWPVTAIDTRATRYFGLGTEDDWRTPRIVADTVLEIVSRDPTNYTGNAVYDEQLLAETGVTDFSEYNLTPGDPAPLSAQMFDPAYERPS